MNVACLSNACGLAVVCNRKQHNLVHIHLSRKKHILKQYSATHQLLGSLVTRPRKWADQQRLYIHDDR